MRRPRWPPPSWPWCALRRPIEEFLGASAYLSTVPMYNYAMPSVFKAWLDHIMIPGRTFGMGDADSAAGRPAVLVSACGGGYGPGSPQHGKHFLVPALHLDVRTITPSCPTRRSWSRSSTCSHFTRPPSPRLMTKAAATPQTFPRRPRRSSPMSGWPVSRDPYPSGASRTVSDLKDV
ncbi:NAD(P)H-dependent oxidoreductase [Streptomyces griseofuscus]|uniref:NAD(P)H-dependent oxidoreductase n=2 Tax=Streptomyces TaxID=1883 RepID=UPI0033DEEB0D